MPPGRDRAFSTEDLLKLRQIGSDLEWPSDARLPFVDVATGSLGQRLERRCGDGFVRAPDKLDYRTYVLMVMANAPRRRMGGCVAGGIYQLNNLVAVVDVNRPVRASPRHSNTTWRYKRAFEAFGWRTEEIEGHDIRRVAGSARGSGPGPISRW